MNITEENVTEQKTLDEFGIDRKQFEIGNDANSKFFKMKDGEKHEVSFVKGGVRQTERAFNKFENGQLVKDANGNPVVERTGAALELDIDMIDGVKVQKTWDISSKKLISTIFSFLDKREKDGTPYLFSRKFEISRKGAQKDTIYLMFPTDVK